MNPPGIRNPGGRAAGPGPLLGVVFDFDGVIADTEGLHLRACQQALAEHGMTLAAADYYDRAYNPYCYYNEEYDCPYPPRENWLTAPVPAGERLAPGYAGFGIGVVPPPPEDSAP